MGDLVAVTITSSNVLEAVSCVRPWANSWLLKIVTAAEIKILFLIFINFFVTAFEIRRKKYKRPPAFTLHAFHPKALNGINKTGRSSGLAHLKSLPVMINSGEEFKRSRKPL
jgi:hypothetical protein